MNDVIFMKRALGLAVLGKEYVFPNPMVGAVIVASDGTVIGEGYHARFGGPHAEIVALSSCHDKTRLHNATIYVTLEPCCHSGKTPPCVDAIKQSGITRVVAAMTDPNPLVNGKGIALLREQGISVDVGCCEQEARTVHGRKS